VLCALLNSFVLDWMIWLNVMTMLNFFYLHQLPVPRLTAKDAVFVLLAKRAVQVA
jgi:hypothetical protein